MFGGKRRVRVSSQSLKRTMRQGDYYKENLGQPSLRTRDLAKVQSRYVEGLSERFPEDIIVKALEWISGKEGLPDLSTKGIAVAPWALEEVACFCQAIQDAGEEIDLAKLKKQVEKDAQPFIAAASQSLDIALSGRMATSGLMTNVDGALAVAHAITTHAVDADIDWFTAVDDLVQEEKDHRRIGALEEGKGEQGSGHLDTQEFSSGVFYRYASLNITQLQKNLGDVSREKALDIAAHVLHMLATEVPSAKQQSFAAHNLADQALVSFSDQPISLANAFEKPVKADQQGGFRMPSAKELNDYWDKIHRGYGLDERCAEFSLEPIELPDGMIRKESLPALEEWVRNDGPVENNA
ncbi:CRISPR-associated Cse4 family protein [Methylophaga lonarensis MPL]|uniref:CRISPR-associated Cse4 family protein n=2 Tax=Methylophaga lonarensis TaxID=999151 RepID=M7NUQ6_9GAMM|nr:CRISPR-associated Cse4 family protein [Methylophaga lonarensis MPL]